MYAVLEASFTVVLVTARQVKQVPGGKTAVRDSEWRAQLLECGRLTASRCFRPDAQEYAIIRSAPGMAARAAPAILAEIGADLSRFPTPAPLASWARVGPGTHESAGQRRPATTGNANGWGRATLNEAAWAASRTTRSDDHAPYLRMTARQGPTTAIGAVPYALRVARWHMLARQVPHQDRGATYFGSSDTTRTKRHHVRRLEQLGFRMILEPAA